ncbi:hypothetical protein NDU88_003084 [Pleurodeles waltl]|uniref:Uncharacterized protein n=1 Tax=Pleurodeles waltl TaxID=8319 RepID=A0AAV7WS13_PLEWA|nr:hypothetical protein NDU88_003084 [Pleurodeles waltl]
MESGDDLRSRKGGHVVVGEMTGANGKKDSGELIAAHYLLEEEKAGPLAAGRSKVGHRRKEDFRRPLASQVMNRDRAWWQGGRQGISLPLSTQWRPRDNNTQDSTGLQRSKLSRQS